MDNCYFLVKDGFVVEKSYPFVQGWIEGPETVAPGYRYADGKFTAPAPTVDWSEQIAARRYQAETAGIEVDGMAVATDDRSKLLINGAAVEAMLDPEYVMRWKAGGAFVDLTAQQVIAVARAVRAHVQACFDREAELLAAVTDGSFTAEMLEQGWPA